MLTDGASLARTAHHIPASRRRPAAEQPAGAPWCSLVLPDLRYSAACLAEATREERRPRPRAIRRTAVFSSWPRFSRDSGVASWSATEERRARGRLRTEAGQLMRVVNTPYGPLDADAVEGADIAPAYHRHSSLWLA